MQFSSVFPLEGKACMSMSLVRRGGKGFLECLDEDRELLQRQAQQGIEGDVFWCKGCCEPVTSAQCTLTSDAGPDTLVSFILSIILLVFHQCPL
jgi:glucose-1-phosphate adenylyltransferase